MENTSGQGVAATVPAEVDRWNWGAFLLNWIWGIGNNTFIALLMFIPFVNFVMPFVLGVKGSAWAWRNKRWESVEQFRSVQRKWAIWAVVAYLAFALLMGGLVFAIFSVMKSSEVYKLAVARAEASQEVAGIVGTPMSAGFPLGSIQVSGPSGAAKVSFSLSGPNGKGTVFLEAKKSLGLWNLDQIVFQQDGTGRRIDLAQ
jgi:hypothetical protein